MILRAGQLSQPVSIVKFETFDVLQSIAIIAWQRNINKIPSGEQIGHRKVKHFPPLDLFLQF